jgi:S-adenosylmethionine:tRNA ribosyltransferase-isomerase
MDMRLSDFDYRLPPELIAQEPPARRQDSRLLFLRRDSGRMEHFRFPQVVDICQPGDVLVLNDTRVVPARLFGRKETGGGVDALVVREEAGGVWQALMKARGKLQEGEKIGFADGELPATVLGRHEEGGWRLRFQVTGDELRDRLAARGKMPLPPYIRRTGPDDPRDSIDRERYQTVFAEKLGAIAAPTAGLHFTEAILAQLRAKGVETYAVTLHVGLGTFKPVTADDPRKHRMQAEFFTLGNEVAESINRAMEQGRRIIAVGTTSVRTLETCFEGGRLRPKSGWTDLFIYPPYEFRVVRGLLTNFHLPKSTLLMLVSAFACRERILAAYQEAIAERYRFYSYGDAMLIL